MGTTAAPVRRDRRARTGVVRAGRPKKAGALSVIGNDGPVFLDGVAVASPELVDALAPGPHDLEVRAEGKPVVKQKVVVVSGETITVDLGSKDGGTVTPPPATTMSTGMLLVGGGAVLAAAAGAGASGLQAALEYAPMERGTSRLSESYGRMRAVALPSVLGGYQSESSMSL